MSGTGSHLRFGRFNRDASLCTLKHRIRNAGPAVVGFATLAQFGCRESGGSQVFAVDDHQLHRGSHLRRGRACRATAGLASGFPTEPEPRIIDEDSDLTQNEERVRKLPQLRTHSCFQSVTTVTGPVRSLLKPTYSGPATQPPRCPRAADTRSGCLRPGSPPGSNALHTCGRSECNGDVTPTEMMRR